MISVTLICSYSVSPDWPPSTGIFCQGLAMVHLYCVFRSAIFPFLALAPECQPESALAALP